MFQAKKTSRIYSQNVMN